MSGLQVMAKPHSCQVEEQLPHVILHYELDGSRRLGGVTGDQNRPIILWILTIYETLLDSGQVPVQLPKIAN